MSRKIFIIFGMLVMLAAFAPLLNADEEPEKKEGHGDDKKDSAEKDSDKEEDGKNKLLEAIKSWKSWWEDFMKNLAAGGETSAETETKAPETGEKAAEAATTIAVGAAEEKAAESGDKAAEAEAKPADAEAKPAEAKESAAESGDKAEGSAA